MNELIKSVVDCQFEKLYKKIDNLDRKIDIKFDNIEKKLDTQTNKIASLEQVLQYIQSNANITTANITTANET